MRYIIKEAPLSIIKALPKISIFLALYSLYTFFWGRSIAFSIGSFNLEWSHFSAIAGIGTAFFSIVSGLYGLSLQPKENIWNKRFALLGASVGCTILGWVGWQLFF